METLKFKTTIKCAGCLTKVTPVLNETVGEEAWEIDLRAPEKFLTVQTEEGVAPATVMKAMESAGYKAEPVN